MEALSVTIITRNEESNIERCLNALQGVADEIIVVDSYSTDRTVEICRRYGCKVTSREFLGFGAQRQYATGLTSHKYVLSLDADEVIDDALRRELIKLKENGFGHRVYAVRVLNYFCGRPMRHSGLKPAWRVRLFNKRYAQWNLNNVADAVTWPEALMPVQLDGSIHHYRCNSLDEFHKKENRIASLQAHMIAGRHASISPLAPRLRAAMQYIRCHTLEMAWLDGAYGRAIASRRYKTTYEAYRMARHLILESDSE